MKLKKKKLILQNNGLVSDKKENYVINLKKRIINPTKIIINLKLEMMTIRDLL
jgi:hypothetical protein